MEIPEYLKVLLFGIVVSFVVIALEPPTVNIISAPISNFTNVKPSIPYTVQEGDNITKSIYFYGSVSNMSKHTGITKEDIVRQLLASRVFITNCTGTQEKKFGDPYVSAIVCTIFGESYWID